MNTKLIKVLGVGALLQLSLAGTGTVQASIYKCISKQGTVTYNEIPCPINHEEKEIAHSKDPKNSALGSVAQHPQNSNYSNIASRKSTSATTTGADNRTKKLDTSVTSQNSGIGAGSVSSANNSETSGSVSNSLAVDSNNSSFANEKVGAPTQFSALKTY